MPKILDQKRGLSPRVRKTRWGEIKIYVGVDLPEELYVRIEKRASDSRGALSAEVRRLLENALDMHDAIGKKLAK